MKLTQIVQLTRFNRRNHADYFVRHSGEGRNPGFKAFSDNPFQFLDPGFRRGDEPTEQFGLIISWIILFSIACAPLRADTAAVLSFPEVAALAVSRNPGVRAAERQWEASKNRVPQARAWPDPMVGFVTMTDPLQTRAGPLEKKYTVSQKFPFLGKRGFKGVIEETRAFMAREMVRAKSLEVLSQTAGAYFGLCELNESIRIHEELADQVRHFARVAERKYAVGAQSQSGVLRAQVELARLLNDLITLKQKRVSVLARLNSLLDRPTGEALTPVFPGGLNSPSTDKESLVARALESRPELRAVRLTARSEEARRALAKREFFPDLTVGYEVSRIGAGTTSMPYDGKDARGIQFQANVPLWFNRLVPGLKEAEYAQEAAQALEKDWENRTRADVEDAWVRLETAKRLVDLYDKTVLPQAEQALNSSARGYESDKVPFLDLLDSVRSLLKFELDSVSARADAGRALADLERVVGGPLAAPKGDSHEN